MSLMESNLAVLSSHCDAMCRHLDEAQDKDVMGHTREGIPMSFNAQNAEIVEEPEYDSEDFSAKPKRGPWEPRDEDLKAGMEMVDWMEEVVQKLSPESILRGIKDMGGSPEDLEPLMNKMGTQLGSIERLDKSREKLQKTLQDVRETHAQLRQTMQEKSATDELAEEIAQVKRQVWRSKLYAGGKREG